jgi:hypothetical protein
MTINLYEPHDGQLEIHKAINNPAYYFIIAIIGRQYGKSTLGWNQALYWALNEPNQIIYWVSPTDNQAQKVYHTIINAIYESKCIKTNKQGKGDCEIIFKNKSKILFRSAAAEDSLRGESVNYMILDEAAFIKKTTLNSILLPMLTVMGKKLLAISTPKGKNWLYDWFQLGQSEDRYKSFRKSSYDSPYANIQFLEDMRKSMSDKAFQQEYLAEFVDSASVFNNISDIMTLEAIESPQLNEKYWAGIDIGLINDASVLSIIDSNGNLVKYYRWEKVESPELIQEFININNIWKFKHIYIEENNQGLTILQELKRKLNNISGFNTNQSTKPEIINNLIHLFNMRNISLIKDELLRIELEAYIFVQKDGGKITFSADNGFHDDIVMSLAIARECYNKNQFDTKFIGMFGPKKGQRPIDRF